jgi:regulatory protein
MQITKIEIQKNNKEKANIFVDGKYTFSLSLNGLLDCGLKEKDEITQEQIEELKTNDATHLAYISALNIISYASKTETELRRKLKEKKFDEKAIDFAVDKMKGYGYVDDEAYVTSYIKSRAMPQGWGEQKIISNLLQKGVDMSLIKEKLAEIFTSDIKEEAILEVSEKYYEKIRNDERQKQRQKLYKYLAGKGYSYDLIKYAVDKTLNAED